jgi:hypothetical protein
MENQAKMVHQFQQCHYVCSVHAAVASRRQPLKMEQEMCLEVWEARAASKRMGMGSTEASKHQVHTGDVRWVSFRVGMVVESLRELAHKVFQRRNE